MSEIILTSNSAGAEESSKALSGVNVQTAKVHVGAAEHEEFEQTEAKNVEVGVFMDGTWNNRSNTDARKEFEKMQNGEYHNPDLAAKYINEDIASFENDYSNIARMEPFYKDKGTENLARFPIYIEGVGTTNSEKDSYLGGGLGAGKTGIPKKMEKACERIAKLANDNGVEDINVLSIDVFGFSRGAAAARNLVHEVFKPSEDAIYRRGVMVRPKQPRHGQLGKALENLGISLGILTVRFVGLYDTVSAYGLDLMADIDDDTAALHLDAVRKSRFTLQLTAADEHRDNFALTNIKSALSSGKGEEYALPGVHADIGGSYVNGEEEKRMFNYSERDYVIDEGWYNSDQITVRTIPHGNYGSAKYVEGRRTLPNTYSHIPLTVMANVALGKEIPILGTDLKSDFIISGYLQKVKSRIDDHVFNDAPALRFNSLTKLKKNLERGEITIRIYKQDLEDSLMIKKLRNEYLHFSARFRNFVNSPNRTLGGLRKREVIDG